VAVSLDQEEWPEVVGTIAGDDTVLVITPDATTARTLQDRLLSFLRE
jgi:transcriptional regulator of arginine metabolism